MASVTNDTEYASYALPKLIFGTLLNTPYNKVKWLTKILIVKPGNGYTERVIEAYNNTSTYNLITQIVLSPKDRNNIKHGGFGIFLVAFILTIFEIIFFYIMVIPQVNNNKIGGLKKIGNIFALLLNEKKTVLKIVLPI